NEHYTSYGIEKLEKAISDVTGIMPDKYLVIDMQTFSKAIDTIGGINITVEKDLSDMAYPGPNGTYTTFSIAKGTYTFDGETALKYARSRHSTSDFDRAIRQQKIAQAVVEKLKEKDFLSQIKSSANIFLDILEGVKTDTSAMEFLAYFKKYQKYELETGNVLTTANYLSSTTNQRGQYILLPKTENDNEIQKYLAELILQ
ncbi:LCP family protein, partial [Candidatus Peregrinibacteria bacterium]|nr:LCP family protein [Candidatus Peregrinibacteria bacterium]